MSQHAETWIASSLALLAMTAKSAIEPEIIMF